MNNSTLGGITIATMAAGGLGIAAATGAFSSSPTYKPINLTISSDLQKDYKNITCVKDIFKEVDWNNGQNISGLVTWDGKLSKENMKSCLAVSWNKEDYETKWKGKLDLVWTFGDNNHGIIIVSTVTANNSQLKVSGIEYILEFKKDSSNWKVVGKENKSETIINNEEDIEKLIIKPGDILENKPEDWGFTFSKDNICNEQECKENASQTSGTHKWEISNDASKGKSLTSWSSNWNTWNKSEGLFSSAANEVYEGINQVYYKRVYTE